MAGELVGIVNAKQASAGIEGLGFAIPANNVITAIKSVIDNGYVAGRATLGIEVEYGTWKYSQFSLSTVTGVIITNVGSNTQFKKGDCIRKIGDREITSLLDYNNAIRDLEADSTVVIQVERENKKMVSVTVQVKENTAKY